jgi:hypothetical protein
MRLAGRALAKGLGRLALWLMPLTIIYEWVGGSFAKSIPERLLYLGLYLALFWLSDLPARAQLPEPPVLAVVRRPVGALLLLLGLGLLGTAFVWLLGPRLGLAPFVPPPWLASEPRRLMLPLMAAWPLALGHTWLRGRPLDGRSYEQLGSFLALGFVLHLASGVQVQALPVLAQHPVTPWVLGLAALSLLALGFVRRGAFVVRFSGLLALGLALRVLGILAWQVDPRVRDMLALVESAQDRFVSGHHPYALYSMQLGSELPLTYFPGLWLGYGLSRLVGLDLRFTGTLAEAGLCVLWALLARRSSAAHRPWAEGFVACFAAVWWFSPSVQWNAIYAEPTLWWALLGTLLGLAFSGRFGWAAVALGYAVATRHFAVVIAPFVLLYFVRTRGLYAALPYVASAGVVASALLTPFVLGEPELFWFGTFRWLREYGPAHLTWFFDRFGFMQLFAERAALPQLAWVQAGLVGLCLLGALLSKPAYIPRYAATASLLFIMFNVLLWDSFLLDGAIAAGALVLTRAAVLQTAQASPTVLAPSPLLQRARALYLVPLGLALTVLCGGYLAFTLLQTLHPRGRDAAHDFMVSAVRGGDFVIDRSDRRLAFVQGSWLLRQQEVPAPIGGELYDGAWGSTHALHAPGRAWLVTQTARDRDMRSSFARLGVVEAHGFDDYTVQAIAPYRPLPVATRQLPEAAGLRPCQVGWVNQTMLGVTVSAERPVVLTLERDQPSAGLMLAAGFPNGETVWPRKPVYAQLRGTPTDATLAVENLSGLQWRAFAQGELAEGPLQVSLRTDDPLPRLVCLQLLWLPQPAAR